MTQRSGCVTSSEKYWQINLNLTVLQSIDSAKHEIKANLTNSKDNILCIKRRCYSHKVTRWSTFLYVCINEVTVWHDNSTVISCFIQQIHFPPHTTNSLLSTPIICALQAKKMASCTRLPCSKLGNVNMYAQTSSEAHKQQVISSKRQIWFLSNSFFWTKRRSEGVFRSAKVKL